MLPGITYITFCRSHIISNNGEFRKKIELQRPSGTPATAFNKTLANDQPQVHWNVTTVKTVCGKRKGKGC